MRKIIINLSWFGLGTAASLALVWAGMGAAIKEDEIRDEIRKERCASFGENTPKDYEGYCNNLGV
jgi:hypothetical protein